MYNVLHEKFYKIATHENKCQPILFFNQQLVKKIVHIATGDERIICHENQLYLYCLTNY